MATVRKLGQRRSETTTSTNFRGAWLAGQRHRAHMRAFLEDDWRSGKPSRIAGVDSKPMGVAGLGKLAGVLTARSSTNFTRC
jgi:hypothetical protein